jgi:isoleucyl-tRNA synthetase
MQKIRELVEAGRALRSKAGVKVRYPLRNATIICTKKIEDKIKDLLDLLQDELNVKDIIFERNTEKFMTKIVKPNHASLGPKFKEEAKTIVKEIESRDTTTLYQELTKKGKITMLIAGKRVILTKKDFEIIEVEKKHIARTDVADVVLLLYTELTPDLEAEGFAREIVRRIQAMRKDMKLLVEQKIVTQIKVDDKKAKILQPWKDYIIDETRSKQLIFIQKPKGKMVKKWIIDNLETEIGIDIGNT